MNGLWSLLGTDAPPFRVHEWDPNVLTGMLLGHLISGAALLAISALLAWAILRRPVFRFPVWLLLSFVCLYAVSGVGHFIEAFGLFQPALGLEAWWHNVTGVVSALTAATIPVGIRQSWAAMRAVDDATWASHKH